VLGSAADIFSEAGVEIKSAISYAIAMPGEPRTALLIRCTKEQAAKLREQALTEHRSVSGCLLHVLERSLWIEERWVPGLGYLSVAPQPLNQVIRSADSRAELFLRCSLSDAKRIRKAATRRNMSISRFVIFSLERNWKAIQEVARGGY
jgi:hypothetical protein